MFSLQGKAALVTGAASGIGEAIAHAFADAGAFVHVADRDAEGGRRVAEAVGGAFVPCDVSQEEDCRRAVQSVLDKHGHCDVLVNNAALGHVGTALSTSGEDLDRLFAVNVKGVLFCCQAALPGMIARRSGSIINLASIGGIIGIRDRLGYCASKFAVVGLTKTMALDHAESQVRINCICPGRVETPFMRALIGEYADPERARAEMASTQALGRVGRPDEIAAAALYLASDEAAFVTGSALIIDGGWSAGK